LPQSFSSVPVTASPRQFAAFDGADPEQSLHRRFEPSLSDSLALGHLRELGWGIVWPTIFRHPPLLFGPLPQASKEQFVVGGCANGRGQFAGPIGWKIVLSHERAIDPKEPHGVAPSGVVGLADTQRPEVRLHIM